MSDRYAKQLILPEIGQAGQARLARARVLCIGAGGLGCAVLPYLAGAGVGHITLIDDDRVERTNLQRQVLFGESHLDQPKVVAAAARLADLNPSVQVRPIPERLDMSNVEELFRAHDVVIDGSDNYTTKYLIGDASVRFGIPLVYGSATGMEAMVTVFQPGQGPCLRCLFPEPPAGWVPNCAEAGVLGPLVGMAGCIQAVEAIKLLVDDGVHGLESLVGRLWSMDARDLSTRRMAVRRRADCRTCSTDPSAIVLAGPAAAIREIAADEARTLASAMLVDVREPAEFAEGHIPGAVNCPLSDLQAGRASLPASGTCVVVYCASGNRSRQAIELAGKRPGSELRNLRGGLAAWHRADDGAS